MSHFGAALSLNPSPKEFHAGCTELTSLTNDNVSDKRADHLSEWINFHHPTTTILNYTTTILGNFYS